MDFVHVDKDADLAVIRLERGKVHALNDQVIEEVHETFTALENDDSVKAVILTGTGKFFSFGFDIPGFMNHSPEAFTTFVTRFTKLYTYMFLYPKPVVAAINGHCIAGGCILATAADYRIMVSGKARIALNEVTFGSSIFAGSIEMLKFCAGSRHAELILTSGHMYSAEEAVNMNLVDLATSDDNLMDEAKRVAREYAAKENSAFVSLKNMLRKPVAEKMVAREGESIREFIKIWYLPATREYLKKIEIRS
jgi:enoyl-CoA hydratase/carnithine racemase